MAVERFGAERFKKNALKVFTIEYIVVDVVVSLSLSHTHTHTHTRIPRLSLGWSMSSSYSLGKVLQWLLEEATPLLRPPNTPLSDFYSTSVTIFYTQLLNFMIIIIIYNTAAINNNRKLYQPNKEVKLVTTYVHVALTTLRQTHR